MEDRLRKFAVLVDAGSFTRAAVDLRLSQPALTVAISKLERELGTQLLIRGPRVFTLTEAGRIAYRSAKELRVTTSNLETQLRGLAAELPIVAIGLIDSLASLLFAASTGAAKFENLVKMSVLVNNSQYLLKAAEHEEIDIAFIAEQQGVASELLNIEPVGIEPLLLVCSPQHKAETEIQLRHHQPPLFISYDQPSTTNRLIQTGLRQRSINITPVFYSSSPEIMLELVLRGKGMSVLPYFLVKDLLAGGLLATISYPDPVIIGRPISSVTRRRKVLPHELLSLPVLLQDRLRSQIDAVSLLA